LAIQDTTEYRTWAEVIQQNLAEVGINITINAMDSSAFYSYGQGDEGITMELNAGSFSSQPDPAWYTMWFLCDQVGIWNLQRWCNPEFDELHRQGLLTEDSAKRQEIYVKMQQLFDEGVAAVWVTYPPEIYAYSPKIIPAFTPNGEMRIHLALPAN
jgi:peptide/nickel transport system substrate-binding protein